MSKRNKDALMNALINMEHGTFSEYSLRINPNGMIELETNGTKEDNASGLKALKLALASQKSSLNQPDKATLITPESSPTISECVEAMWAERRDDFTSGTVRTYNSAFNKLKKGLGDNTPIALIDSEKFVKWRKTEDARLSPKTVSRDVLAYSMLFDWAINRGKYFGKNPVEDAKLSKLIWDDRVEAHSQDHDPFELQDLNLIFDPSQYNALEKPCAFWLPLLGLYTGARINSLASIKVSDIQEYEAGKYSVYLSGKTIVSKRTIPIHPDLIRLGFIDYLKDVKTYWPDAVLAFPYLKAGSKNGYGNSPGKEFSSRKSKLGLGKNKVFHSFRKLLITCLQVNGCSQEFRKIYVGHSDGKDQIHEAVYSHGKSDPNAIAKLVFDYLDYAKYIGFELNIESYTGNRFKNYLLRMQRKQA